MDTQQLIIDAAQASRTFYQYTDAQLTVVLQDTAAALLNEKETALKANAQDLARIDANDPKYDRLKLTESRLKGMADDMRNVASLSSPVGKILNETVRPNGMFIRKVSVPFGVIGIIYEARPNVTFDVFSLCLKSGNVCVLKGGSDAEATNLVLVSIIRRVLEKHGLNPAVCTLLPAIREATTELLNAVGLVDLLIPRGSSSLINYVRNNALIPVIETGAGICHTYFDKTGDKEKARAIVNNAKTRRVSVCNALDCLLINEQRLLDLPYICEELIKSHVEIFADAASYETLSGGEYPMELLKQATPESYGTEFLDYKMSIRTVADVAEAVEHIARYSSKHSECIITESPVAIRYFEQAVDAACIYVNASTAFTDGAQFGMGSEIGISTQKLHARGPMGLRELTTYKYIIEGNGQTRN